MYILRTDAVDLFRSHPGFEHRHRYIAQQWSCSGQILFLLVIRQHASLLVVLLKKLDPAYGIAEWYVRLENKIKDGLQAGKFAVHSCRADSFSRGLPLLTGADGFVLSRACFFESLHFFRRDLVERNISEVAQQSDAAHLVTTMR